MMFEFFSRFLFVGDVLGIVDSIKELLAYMTIWLSSGIYKVAAFTFKIFIILANGELISNDAYKTMVENFYLIIGVITLFIVAFSLLKGMVNPEDKNSGTSAVKKMIINFITSIAMIALLPTIFGFAFDFQKSVVQDYNVIGKFFGFDNFSMNNSNGSKSQVEYGANMIVNSVWTAFFNVNEGDCVLDTAQSIIECQDGIEGDSMTLGAAITSVKNNGTFGTYTQFADSVATDKISFNWFLSLIGGFLLLYIGIVYCIDMGVRLVKLVFYQLIAPVPILLRIMPDNKMGGMFKKWFGITLTCYLEVFLRLIILYFSIYLCVKIEDSAFLQYGNGWDFLTWLFTKAFIFIGIIAFMKSAPKLLSEATGIDSGNMKLGLKDALAAAGIFGLAKGAGKLGAGVASMAAAKGNPFAFKRGWKNGWANVGGEVTRRHEMQDALAAGATRRQIYSDQIKKKFGFSSAADAETRKIDQSSEIAQNRSAYNIKGMYFDENGNRYEGALFDANGNSISYKDGKYRDAAGNEYKGQLYGVNKQKLNELNSKSGLYYYENGNRYQGKIYDDQKQELSFDSEKGIYLDSNGNEYKGQLYDASLNKIRSGFMFNTNDIEALEALKVKNTAAISQASDEIRALEKKIAYGSTQIKFKSNLKGEAESKIDEKGSKVVYGFKYKDLNGIEQTFTGTFKEIEDFRSMKLTADQLADTESLEQIRSNMVAEFIKNEMASANDNKIKQNMRAGFNTILNNGGYTYSYYDEKGVTREGKIEVTKDENTGEFVIHKNYVDSKGNTISEVSTKNASGIFETIVKENGTEIRKEFKSDFDVVSDIDKLAKGSNNVLNDEKQRIDETIIDGYRGQNEAIDNIVKQVKEQKEAKRKSDEQRSREAAKKYTANRK